MLRDAGVNAGSLPAPVSSAGGADSVEPRYGFWYWKSASAKSWRRIRFLILFVGFGFIVVCIYQIQYQIPLIESKSSYQIKLGLALSIWKEVLITLTSLSVIGFCRLRGQEHV